MTTKNWYINTPNGVLYHIKVELFHEPGVHLVRETIFDDYKEVECEMYKVHLTILPYPSNTLFYTHYNIHKQKDLLQFGRFCKRIEELRERFERECGNHEKGYNNSGDAERTYGMMVGYIDGLADSMEHSLPKIKIEYFPQNILNPWQTF